MIRKHFAALSKEKEVKHGVFMAVGFLSAVFCLSLMASDSADSDWPMWGGKAERNMTSAMKNLPDSWDVNSGENIKRKLDMMNKLGVFQLFMANSSPVIWEDLIFLETSNGWDSNDENIPAPKAPSFIAVNKDSGEVVWQEYSPGENILHGQWSSPALGLVNGIQQVFFAGGDGWLYGFNARTGEKLWKFDLNPKDAKWPKTRNYGVATPVFHAGKVFMSVGQDPDGGIGVGHAYCIDPAKQRDTTETGLVWLYDKINRSISTVAVADGLVYIADIKGNLHCLDAGTGKAYWTFDMMVPVWGSAPVADGKVYLGDEDGDVAILKASKELKQISEIQMGISIYGTPVPANGVLYIMTSQHLYAISGDANETKK